MTDREKVIKGLQEIVNSDWMWKKADYWALICKNALALLEEQEPVKPIFQKYAYCCGNCGEDLARYYPPNGIETRFCPFCGRAVKWDS